MSWSQRQVTIQFWIFSNMISYHYVYNINILYHICDICDIRIQKNISYTAWSSLPGHFFRTRNEPFWSHLRSKIWQFQTYDEDSSAVRYQPFYVFLVLSTFSSRSGIFWYPRLCPQRLTWWSGSRDESRGIKGAYRGIEEENCTGTIRKKFCRELQTCQRFIVKRISGLMDSEFKPQSCPTQNCQCNLSTNFGYL